MKQDIKVKYLDKYEIEVNVSSEFDMLKKDYLDFELELSNLINKYKV